MLPRSRLSTTAVAGAVLGVVLAGGGAAVSAWSQTGNGTGAAAAATLGAPTSVAAAAVSSSQINITWNAPASGPAPASYQVVRNGTTTLGCTSSPCSDSGLTAGTTYSYVVSAKLGTSWVRAAGSVSAATNAAASRATTSTLTSSQNPAKSGSPVTFTVSVAPTTGTGTPTGTVTFKDGSTTISCASGNQTLTSGSATCSTSALAQGAHSITAVYSGDSTFVTSTSNTVAQRIVNGNVAGLGLSNVQVNGSSTGVTYSCDRTAVTAVACTVTSSTANNDRISAHSVFVNAAGAATTYASDADTLLPWTGTSGNQSASGTLTTLAGQSTSSTSASMQRGSKTATITISLSDGLNTFTITLSAG